MDCEYTQNRVHLILYKQFYLSTTQGSVLIRGCLIALCSFNYRRTFSTGTLLLLLHAMNSDTTPLTEHLSEGGRVYVVLFLPFFKTIMLQIPCSVPLPTVFAKPKVNPQVPEPINSTLPYSVPKS